VMRRRAGRPVTQGGTDHASHRLVGLGLSGRETALVLYLAQIACSTIAVVAVNSPDAVVPVLLAWAASGLVLGVLVGLRRRERYSSTGDGGSDAHGSGPTP